MKLKLNILFSIYRYKGRVVSILPIREIYNEVDHKLNLTSEERDELLKWANKFEKSKEYNTLYKRHQETVSDLASYNEPTFSGEVLHLPSLGQLTHSTETKEVTVNNI